ncbi:MAG: DNA topoisomerase VI subunit B [Thaumarchaeota archaeon]|nr:DNA topoisomerase VI subunit B [Nitrososphaerota archaeon]
MVTFSEISPSEFFYRNRDLAGFTNPARALYMAVRELVENSLDASELAGMLPDVYVRIVADGSTGDSPEPRAYRLTVADNGPGVDPHHVPRAFGKVFYGSKYVLRQSRGMFGMGGTMAVLYGQITTNKAVKVTTSTDGKSRHIFEMLIDIGENKPIILRRDTEEAGGKTGTRVDIMLEGDFTRSAQKINEYFKQTALVGSYANLTFVDPIGRISTFERATEALPPPPKETLPHPYGVDVEAFKRMVKLNEEKTMVRFMTTHFHRIGERTAQKFLAFAGVEPKLAPEKLTNEQVVRVVDALQRFQEFLPPDSSCLSPVGEQILQTGIIKELEPEFSTVVMRPPSSYSGFPFLVEVGLAYGGKALEPGRKLLRFANRIPLLYDESSDVSFKVLNEEIDWRRYHVPDEAPVAVITHICSTKVPYKTVGKEYIADRPEIEAEIRNAVREALRRLSLYLSKKGSMEAVQRKMNIYAKYLPLIARFSTDLAGQKRLPKYKQLIADERDRETAADEAVEGTSAPLEAEQVMVQVDGKNVVNKKHEQAKIEDYS